jgi:hypothetical protein
MRDAKLFNAVQNAVLAEIAYPHCVFEAPPLKSNSYDPLLTSWDGERERLEFVGDGLIGACINLELYYQYPNGDPNFYTVSTTLK